MASLKCAARSNGRPVWSHSHGLRRDRDARPDRDVVVELDAHETESDAAAALAQAMNLNPARWQQLADQHQLEIEHWGIPALTGYSFQSEQNLAYKTLITQEMLAKGYLAGNSVYVSTEHVPEVLDGYFNALDPIFALIKECEDGRDVMALLNGPICHAGFKRLN